IARLREEGLEPTAMQAILDRLLVLPVFTAHPTEAKRRTMLTKLDRLASALRAGDLAEPTPEESARWLDFLREEIVSLWQTDEARSYRPGVLDEVRNGLYFLENTVFDL